MLFILHTLFYLVFIVYYFPSYTWGLERLSIFPRVIKWQSNFKHHILLFYMKTKKIFFSLAAKICLQGSIWIWYPGETCPHLKVSTDILSANVFLFTAPLFVCMVIIIMLSEVLNNNNILTSNKESFVCVCVCFSGNFYCDLTSIEKCVW